MCRLFHCIRRSLLTTILISVFITFCPNIPPNATYIPFGNQLKPQKLGDDTSLNNAERILEGQLVGPEAFTVHEGALYTGLHGGHVVKVLPNKIVPVVKTGNECAGIHQEHICGRPLGLRVRNDILYIADAYKGILSHNLATGPGKPKQLLEPNVIVNGKPAKIFNCVEVDKDGIIYVTSSSSEFDVNKGLHALLASGTGRLLKFDPKTKKVTQLLDNMFFPNGLALSADEEYIFVAETINRKVFKYHLKTGNVQTILEGLPGLPDNIQYAGDNTYWASLVSPSDEETPALTDVLANWPNIRKFLGRFVFLLEFPFKLINEYYPNSFCELASYHIGHLGPLLPLFPDKVTIVRFDGDTGKILDALQGDNGAVKCISDVAVVGDYLYLGSPANNYVGRLALFDSLKGKYAQTEEASKYKSDSSAQARKSAEEARAAEEAKAKKAAEEAKAKKAAEEAKAVKAAEEARAKKAAEDAKQKAAEEAKAKKAAEDAKKAAEDAKQKAAEEAKAKKAAEDAKKAAEDAKQKAAEEAKAKKAVEDAKRAAEDAKAKKAVEDAKRAAEDAKAKKAVEDAKRAAEDAKARKAAEEAKRAAEAAAKAAKANKKISEDEIKSNKISEDAGKTKVPGDKTKTEL